MPERNIVEAINNALGEEMEHDPRVMVLGLDVGKLGGVFRTTSGLVERFGGERAAHGGDPRPRSGPFLRARPAVPSRPLGGAGRRLHRALWQGGGGPRG